MNKIILSIITTLLISFLLYSCNEAVPTKTVEIDNNPAAKGFNLENSDQKAIELADNVMAAMGGRTAYDQTRYLSWNFFGSRRHVWDKNTGDVYIKNLKQDYELYMNIHKMTGSMLIDGQEVVNQDTLSKYLSKGKEMWINDAYWLVMPYKLKDSGVTIKYLGNSKTKEDANAEKLELTFEKVGVTPENKYHIYIDKSTNLVTQWDFFQNSTDTIPRFSTPWDGYKDFGNIKLSGGRGKGSLTEISVSDTLKTYFERGASLDNKQ